MSRLLRFRTLKWLSFSHSVVYAALLFCAIAGYEAGTRALGWAHGVGWIVMSILCLVATRRRIIPFWLAVTVCLIGGLGPFAGTIGFFVAERREHRTRRVVEA